jgi:hypothetical protein
MPGRRRAPSEPASCTPSPKWVTASPPLPSAPIPTPSPTAVRCVNQSVALFPDWLRVQTLRSPDKRWEPNVACLQSTAYAALPLRPVSRWINRTGTKSFSFAKLLELKAYCCNELFSCLRSTSNHQIMPALGLRFWVPGFSTDELCL